MQDRPISSFIRRHYRHFNAAALVDAAEGYNRHLAGGGKMLVTLAGAMSTVSPLGRWWASVPKARWPKDPRSEAQIRENWAEPWGDRRQEMVFIGAGMDVQAIRAALDACLIGDGWTPARWEGLSDPFPRWGK